VKRLTGFLLCFFWALQPAMSQSATLRTDQGTRL
jgi:hypothetical protein